MNRKWFLLLAMLVFIPLLFLNIRSDHDWGDDFAQYLAQAENIAQGKPMAQTGYIYNPEYPSLGPKAYPPGFPLMIAPMVAKYGNQVTPYNHLISVILILTALFSVLLLYKKAGWPTAILLSALIYYNPYTLKLKAEIMADIPFALLFGVFLWLASENWKKNTSQWIIAGIVAGLAITIKSIGIESDDCSHHFPDYLFWIQPRIYAWVRRNRLSQHVWCRQNNGSFCHQYLYLFRSDPHVFHQSGFSLILDRVSAGRDYLRLFHFGAGDCHLKKTGVNRMDYPDLYWNSFDLSLP